MTTRRLLLALALLSASPAAADALQDRLLAGARAASPEAFAFTRSSRNEQSDGGKPEIHSRVERFDPSKPPAQRWTLVSVDGHAPSADDVAKARKAYASAPVPGYGRLARWIGVRAAPDAGGRVYRYAALPKGIFEINGHDLSADTSAEVVLGGGVAPFVERTRFVSTKPFRIMLVAKVERVEATQTFRLMPDGRPVPIESVVEMKGAMMGKAGTSRTVTTYSDWRAVGSPSR